MPSFVSDIMACLTGHPLGYGHSDIQSLLEMLWKSYTLRNPIGSDLIKEKFLLLEPITHTLSRKRARRIRRVMEELCAEYEKEAFLTGIRVGVQLMAELAEPSQSDK